MAADQIKVYLEVGQKKTIAGAVDWPGWCRGGRDEASALQTLLDYAPRYASVMKRAGIDFRPPHDLSAFTVVDRLDGNSGTDYGIPAKAPSADQQSIDEDDLARFHLLLKACWQALEERARAYAGRELRKGPRGGGRDLENILHHVSDAERGYASSLAWKAPKVETEDLRGKLQQNQQAVLDALDSAVHNGLPEHGPRGGTIWLPRYFVRRVAWHVLDHVWEIDDRVVAAA